MSDILVVNASPVIVLAKAGHLELLSNMARQVLIPDAVAAEILAGPMEDPARGALEAGWGTRVVLHDIPAGVLEWGLGRGESEVLAFALRQPQATAILDDALGRTCARVLGVRFVGTLGLVIRARKRGLIASAADVLEDLRKSGLYLDDNIVSLALKHTVNERWKP